MVDFEEYYRDEAPPIIDSQEICTWQGVFDTPQHLLVTKLKRLVWLDRLTSLPQAATPATCHTQIG